MFQTTRRVAVMALACGAAAAFAQSGGEIRIAHVYSKTGPLEAYGKQTQVGLMMGLNYATGGTMMVAGKKIVVIEKDDQGKPDLGKSLLATAYSDDKAASYYAHADGDKPKAGAPAEPTKES